MRLVRRSTELSMTAENSERVGVGTSGAAAWILPKSARRYWPVQRPVARERIFAAHPEGPARLRRARRTLGPGPGQPGPGLGIVVNVGEVEFHPRPREAAGHVNEPILLRPAQPRRGRTVAIQSDWTVWVNANRMFGSEMNMSVPVRESLKSSTLAPTSRPKSRFPTWALWPPTTRP